MAMPPTTTTTTSTASSSTAPYTSKSSFLTYGLNPLRTCALNNTQIDCSICLEKYTYENPASKITQCGHIFHAPCMIEWVEAGSSTCPMCRAQLYLPPSRSMKSNSNNPRRNMFARRAGEWSVPSLPYEIDADGERYTVTIENGERILRIWERSSARGTGIFDPDVPLDRALRGEGMQRGFDTISQWRMGALGLGTGMGGGLHQSTSETPLDY